MAETQADRDPELALSTFPTHITQADLDHGVDGEELEQIESNRLQHVRTFGSERLAGSRSLDPTLPGFGAGKSYPPHLNSVQDAYVVEFDGPNDPIHPLNWSFWTKVAVTAIGILQVFSATFASAILASAQQRIAEYFHIGVEVAAFCTTLYLLGFVTGPMIFGPLSEVSGRKLPMVISAFGFAVFGAATAVAKDVQTLMICRFFQGVFGSGPIVVLAAICADIWKPEQRTYALTLFAVCAFVPAMLAPIVGSFTVTSYLGWRWCCYWTTILGFTSFTLTTLFLKESFYPVVLVKKAQYLRRATQNWAIHAKFEEIEIDLRALLEKNLLRPVRMLIQEPILAMCGLYVSFVYGLMYMTLAAYPFIFQKTRGYGAGVGSLPFLGLVIGMSASGAAVVYNTKFWVRKYHANNNKGIPEWRMPLAIVGAISFAAGIFWLGWSGNYGSVHWIVPTIAGVFVGFGILTIFTQLILYIIDGYLMFAASAAAGNMMARSLFAAVCPLFDRQMFQNIGIQWGCTLLGCLALIMIPFPFVFIRYGPKLRERSVWAPTPAPVSATEAKMKDKKEES
ncbi:major facilitator superfamily domain-containing protein [Xylogone sp. PMI_703]|nr:major facilitator superfamily domain-containing protein [Xylogone sp. PMI_703]